MSSKSVHTKTPTIEIYIRLAQYPILSDQIRLRMREELFSRGVIDQNDFEFEVKRLALESQKREGLLDPYSQEDQSTWHKRLATVRDIHTDSLFANNLGVSLLDQIINEVLYGKPRASFSDELTFNPEIAPWTLLFHQGAIYERMPPPEQDKVKHHLEELKVVLIKRLISDHLKYIGLAKQYFSVKDLQWIYERMVGTGKIGGKAAGMLLAWKILEKQHGDFGPDIGDQVYVPETFFVGSEIIYEFLAANQLEDSNNQKYLPEAEQVKQFSALIARYLKGNLPEYILKQLREVMRRIDNRPFIVRSSSLLEDNLSYRFYDVYESVICPNQGSEAENFSALLDAIRRIYASSFNPRAIKLRKQHGLLDYDERMGLMIQILGGEQYGRYFFPAIMGSGRSSTQNYGGHSEGTLQLTLGFDERFETRQDKQLTYTIQLHNPHFREAKTVLAPGRSPQSFLTVLDLEANSLKELPLYDVLTPQYKNLSFVASSVRDGTFCSIEEKPEGPFALTFYGLTKDSRFIKLMRTIIARLETAYKMPIHMEILIKIQDSSHSPNYKICILQCHPQH